MGGYIATLLFASIIASADSHNAATPACDRSVTRGISVVPQSLWPVPVLRLHADADLAAALRPIVLGLQRKTRGIRKSNRGGWHSAPGALLDAIGKKGVAASLPGLILAAASEYVRQGFIDERRAAAKGECSLHLEGLWANVNDRGHGNIAHTHQGLLSGAFYVDTGGGNSTTFCLGDPRHAADEDSAESDACRSFPVFGARSALPLQLRAGDLLLFPSWVRHPAPPHDSDGTRVTIAFNVRADLLGTGELKITTPGLAPASHWKAPVSFPELEGVFATRVLRASSIQTPPDFRTALERAIRNVDARRKYQHLGANLVMLDKDALAKSQLVEVWRCLGLALVGPSLLDTLFVLKAPSGYAEMEQTLRLPSKVPNSLAGVHVLQGVVRLWLIDPRPAVEVAAAADPAARRLFGQKISVELRTGNVLIVPAWLASSLEVQESALCLVFGLRTIVSAKANQEYLAEL
eukprot:TRINITY_DN22275_c0_g1_i1.p1 TRINITY_DN22275_c0_g1~~TRINITY_DN22275_c0_g1_i1.p1  ORF type:complete len:464 (+),score=60.05 TRINITY_DN22275_c0_g1_i1:81-1472(+)